ncbi:MAG: RHS repeat-associated core domain-containing protein [Methylophagaceae bacterium]
MGSYTFDANSTILLSSDGNGLVIADGLKLIIPSTSTPAGVVYVHNDHLGTPQTITDQSQQIVWQASYTPFGEATITTEAITNNIRFPGQYYDQETNLHYNYFRYYDPSLGRYITSDPIGLAGGINTYGYVGGNPLGYIDVFGLAWSLAERNGFSGPTGNGNQWGEFEPQDGVCSWPADKFNNDSNTKSCCVVHDQCYEQHSCNWSSWFGGSGACVSCNMQAIECINDTKESNQCK